MKISKVFIEKNNVEVHWSENGEDVSLGLHIRLMAESLIESGMINEKYKHSTIDTLKGLILDLSHNDFVWSIPYIEDAYNKYYAHS